MFIDDGKLIRPFTLSAKVRCRGYSMPLQRVMTDFGADSSFASATEKIKEHYGVEVPVSAVVSITENHAERMLKSIDFIQADDNSFRAPDQIIAETDGSMIPIISINNDIKSDKRKTRKTEWCEARLALARARGSRTPVFSALIGSVDEAGKQLAAVVDAVGRGKKTMFMVLVMAPCGLRINSINNLVATEIIL